MNPFEILIPGTVVIVFLVFPAVMLYRAGRPTESEQAAYDFGWQDGRTGATPLKLDSYDLQLIYTEAYMDGCRIRDRKADTETLRQRAARTES